MVIEVQHWSGAGNRFVIVDNRKGMISNPLDVILVRSLCQRKDLPAAEGLLVLLDLNETDSKCYYDFYNPDGSTGVMCGNGARCAVRHAASSGHLERNLIELILNGCMYCAELIGNDRVALRLPVYKDLRLIESWTYVNVGSHHVVIDARDIVQSIEDFHRFDLIRFAQEHLNSYRKKVGIESLNLTIAYPTVDQQIVRIRTYENGVFDETQACGTGAVSTAIAFWIRNIIRQVKIQLIPTSQRMLTVHLDINTEREEIIQGMTLEGDARQDTTSSQFDIDSMRYL
ncbi:unnamed protein product [Adineta ricciae]|uniref:diaminopimelate epimerase n=1 Tax=Adineta ricciae TaxID=249248 RepID=A0A814TCB1_ADIRI|nr:unnamed protein product [Adineta ricciae]CAF1219161.1 unnamed protein product [Adineta ricciae]